MAYVIDYLGIRAQLENDLRNLSTLIADIKLATSLEKFNSNPHEFIIRFFALNKAKFLRNVNMYFEGLGYSKFFDELRLKLGTVLEQLEHVELQLYCIIEENCKDSSPNEVINKILSDPWPTLVDIRLASLGGEGEWMKFIFRFRTTIEYIITLIDENLAPKYNHESI
jgi:hypothetical protein